ncbi:nuclear transport factor 2 family protein [Stappia sp. ICDLI1TA098]
MGDKKTDRDEAADSLPEDHRLSPNGATLPVEDDEDAVGAALEEAAFSLFDDYRDAFDDFDAEGIADCFAYPAVIWQFGKGNVFQDDEELLENIEKLLAALGKEGVVNSTYEVVSGHLEGDAGLVTLAWSQNDADGEPLLEFVCHYHLIYSGTDWSIAMIVNEP